MSQKQKLSCDSLSVEQPPLKKCRDTTEDSNKHSWVCDYCKAPFPSYDEASLHEQTCSKRGLVENGDPVQNTMPPYYPPAVVNKIEEVFVKRASAGWTCRKYFDKVYYRVQFFLFVFFHIGHCQMIPSK